MLLYIWAHCLYEGESQRRPGALWQEEVYKLGLGLLSLCIPHLRQRRRGAVEGEIIQVKWANCLYASLSRGGVATEARRARYSEDNRGIHREGLLGSQDA